VTRDRLLSHRRERATKRGETSRSPHSCRNSCFEYRSDGEGPESPDHFNPEIEDGLWPYVCVVNTTEMLTLSALEYVEIRMVFGAETDERFDWTRVEVEPVPGAKGLQIAKSGPAGERANENARFNR
jgi:hypothetical protein